MIILTYLSLISLNIINYIQKSSIGTMALICNVVIVGYINIITLALEQLLN